jgi:hypothetical protein
MLAKPTFVGKKPSDLRSRWENLIQLLGTYIVRLNWKNRIIKMYFCRQAKASGLPLTVETCHHYLRLDIISKGFKETVSRDFRPPFFS